MKFLSTKPPDHTEPIEWTVKVRLKIGGWQFREVDITAALGIGLIGVFAYFMAIQETLVR